MTRELTATTEQAGLRLDAFLAQDGALSRSQAAQLIASGHVRVDGKQAAKSCRLAGGERVSVDIPEGSKITVTQNGVTHDYERSGKPAVYSCHQEVPLELFKEWA